MLSTMPSVSTLSDMQYKATKNTVVAIEIICSQIPFVPLLFLLADYLIKGHSVTHSLKVSDYLIHNQSH